MEKFIYVFNESAKEKLSDAGFCMLKADDRNSVYVFAREDGLSLNFSNDEDFEYVLSDMLTF